MFPQKYRPKDFDMVVGNKHIISSLKGHLRDPDNMPHFYVFIGPPGTGKTTFGKILARKLGCYKKNMALLEYNAANTRGIDTAREVILQAHERPWKGSYKLFILDESQSLTKDA